jgi:hypothetical protein
MFPFIPHPIHFCSQWLHLWVTASPEDLVYRLHIRKYFGTEIWVSAEADSSNRFLGGAREYWSNCFGRASV